MYEHFKSFIHNMILTSQSDYTNKCSHLQYMRASILCTLIHNMYTSFFITVLDGEEWNIIIAYMFNYLIITKVKYIIEFVKQCSHTELYHVFLCSLARAHPLPGLSSCACLCASL